MGLFSSCIPEVGLGCARIKEEGAPVHPADLEYDCPVKDCQHCGAHRRRQAQAYFDHQRAKGVPEAELQKDPHYVPSSVQA